MVRVKEIFTSSVAQFLLRKSRSYCVVLNIHMQHADNSRRGTFGRCGSLIHNYVLMYSADGTNLYGSRGEEFEGIGLV